MNNESRKKFKLNITPNKIKRVLIWLLFNVLIFFAVAITNGFVVYFFGLLSSCLLASWMITSFLFSPASPQKQSGVFSKIFLMGIGILCGAVFTYGHPFYLGATLAIVIHEMRILFRYKLSPLTAFLSPLISLLPIIPISHASYTELTLSSLTYQFEAILGYVIVVITLLVGILLIKRDDRNLLPLLGKSEEEYAFEKVGIPKFLCKKHFE